MLLALAGCVESLPTSALPTLKKDDRKLLSKEEQQAAIGDLAAKKEAETQRALKDIQKAK